MTAHDVNEQRLNDHERRLDKYDLIIDKISEMVTVLSATAKNNGKWIMATLSVVAVFLGAFLTIIVYILTHLH